LSLKKLAFSSSIWVIIDVVIGQGLRFVSNVILTRLLAPEVFGLMGIVNAVLTGLHMFSDVGLKPSVIQNPRGEEPAFLRTAWTIQVIRGILLTLAAILLAWPIAAYYNEPSLILLISVAGFTALIAGFESTWLLVLSRRMHIGKMTILELVSYLVGVIVMIACAWYFHSIWALILGTFVTGILILIFSHTILAGLTMRFQWESTAVKELIHFGRWIFISTALSFLVSSLDVFILGSFGGLAVLGIYILAKNLSRLAINALLDLSSTVLFPVYSRLSEQGFDTLRDQTFKTRALLLLVFLPPLWLMVFLGDDFIHFVYDERYADAGWMLQILVAGSISGAIMATISPVLLAVGNSFKNLIFTASQLGFQIIGMLVGAYVAGVEGFIIGIAISELLCYPILVYLIYPYKVWLPMLDMIAFGSSFIVVGLAFY
jgi:O-antigen/teichoic acid export membrane protein